MEDVKCHPVLHFRAESINYPVSILYKYVAVRYRPIKVADGPITVRSRFIKNASWVKRLLVLWQIYMKIDLRSRLFGHVGCCKCLYFLMDGRLIQTDSTIFWFCFVLYIQRIPIFWNILGETFTLCSWNKQNDNNNNNENRLIDQLCAEISFQSIEMMYLDLIRGNFKSTYRNEYEYCFAFYFSKMAHRCHPLPAEQNVAIRLSTSHNPRCCTSKRFWTLTLCVYWGKLSNAYTDVPEFLGRLFYNQVMVYKCQNFLKIVVHVLMTDQCIDESQVTVIYSYAILVAVTSERCW